MRRLLFFVFMLLVSSHALISQVENLNPQVAASVRAEISRRGLTEQEVADRLKMKGIALDVNTVTVAQLQSLRPQLEATLNELENEKKTAQGAAVNAAAQQKAETIVKEQGEAIIKQEAQIAAKSKAEDIKEEIKKGSSVEEAVSKALIEGAKEAPSTQPAVIYGQHIFKNNNLGYIKDRDFKAPDTYVLSTGDKITITVSSGIAFYNKTYEVDKEGKLMLENMPRPTVKGLTLATAKKLLYNTFRTAYPIGSQEDFSVTVAAARIIAVNITGEVEEPGTYTISAGNSAFNALVAAKGTNSIGSVRNITLIRTTGEKKTMDVYEYLIDPSVARNFFLYENDYIHVPVAQKLVSVQGAVKRPNFKYELLKNENLMKLIEYAGGLTENAYQSNFQVKRFVNDIEKIIDLNYRELKQKGGDFELLNGDVLVVKTIPEPYKNYVNIDGALELPGRYELTEGMRLSDVIKKANLKKEARTDVAYLQRINDDKTIQLLKFNIEEILKNSSSPNNLILKSEDIIIIYTQERYTRKDFISISGAVRSPSRIPFDANRNVKITDLITIAGGTLPNATSFAYLMRRDTSNSIPINYQTIDLNSIIKNPNSADNQLLRPFDSIHIFTKESYMDNANVKVSGSVRSPGEYRFDRSLSLKDVLTLASGLKLEAATNRVDIFRVVLDSVNPVRTVAATIAVDRDMNILDERYKTFQLEPYDQIVVRALPDFSFQKIVNVSGEVKYPGPYALLEKNEKLTSILARAGGLTQEAFIDGASLYRSQDNVGFVIMDLDDAFKNPSTSKHNFILREGDLIEIPKLKDFVTIQGATKAGEIYTSQILNNGKINVAYNEGKRAWFYVDKYAAGTNKDGRKYKITVTQPNGKIERTKHFLIFNIFPKVEKGAIVNVGVKDRKPAKSEKEKKEKSDFDFRKAIADTFATTVSVLSLILLIRSLNN